MGLWCLLGHVGKQPRKNSLNLAFFKSLFLNPPFYPSIKKSNDEKGASILDYLFIYRDAPFYILLSGLKNYITLFENRPL
jgi:hypothetical protein